MADFLTPAGRSSLMSRIKAGDTSPEWCVRRNLFKLGFRYRLHDRALPGRPDIVLKRFNVVIFVHGCFWHRHQDCKAFKLPATRRDWWREKLERNAARDRTVQKKLLDSGLRVAIVWECAVRRLPSALVEARMQRLADWIRSGDAGLLEISG